MTQGNCSSKNILFVLLLPLLLTQCIAPSVAAIPAGGGDAAVSMPRIVFTSAPGGNGNTENGRGIGSHAEIYVMNADGTEQTRLTNDDYWDDEAAVSPDGKRIVFVEDGTGNSQVYIMNADGSDVTRLTNNHATEDLPAFSPDGTHIAFLSDRDGNPDIYSMQANGSNQTRLTDNPGLDEYPSYSPDGTQILFNSRHDNYQASQSIEDIRGTYGDIYSMNADGSNQTRLTDSKGHNGRPLWSPDGKKILFDTNRDGNGEIYVMNADGSDVTNLTKNRAFESFPNWSLDGKQIAFGSDRDDDLEIYVMNADGSNLTRLTNNPGDDVWPSWQVGGIATAGALQPATSATTPANTPANTPLPATTNDIVAELVLTGEGDAGPTVAGALVFQVTAYDPAAGNQDGDGIDHVDFDIFGADGKSFYQHTERTAPYCAFNNETEACNVYDFAENQYQWINGQPVQNGDYRLLATVYAQDGSTKSVETLVTIQGVP